MALFSQSPSVEVFSEQQFGLVSSGGLIGAIDTFSSEGYLIGVNIFATNAEGEYNLEPKVYRVSQEGNLTDSILLAYPGSQEIREIKISPNGNIWLAMEDVTNEQGASSNIRLTSLDSNLIELQSELFITGEISESIVGMAIGSENEPIVAYKDILSSSSDLFLEKYNFEDNTLSWRKAHQIEGGFQFGGEIETNLNDQVLITFQSSPSNWLGVAYQLSDGTVLFTTEINQPFSCPGNAVENPGLSRPVYDAFLGSYFMTNACFDVLQITTDGTYERYPSSLAGFEQDPA